MNPSCVKNKVINKISLYKSYIFNIDTYKIGIK